MLRHLSWSLAALVGLVTSAAAQGAGGTWKGKSMVGPKDSVVFEYLLTIDADAMSATIMFNNHDPIPARIIAVAGDSIVTEAGPYAGILRPGQMVKSLRTVAHYKGNDMWGTFEATYQNGDVVKGKTQARRPQ
jgi:hypothetical protein